jgi:hypothetical protein
MCVVVGNYLRHPSSKACLFVKDGKCVRTEGIQTVTSVLIGKDRTFPLTGKISHSFVLSQRRIIFSHFQLPYPS